MKIAEPLTGIGLLTCFNELVAITNVPYGNVQAVCAALIKSENNESFGSTMSDAQWADFVRSKEYRGYVRMPSVTVDCSAGRIAGFAPANTFDQSPGYTKSNLPPKLVTRYHAGEVYRDPGFGDQYNWAKPVYRLAADRSEIAVTYRLASRIATTERLLAFGLLGFDAPYVWTVVEQRITCTGSSLRVRQSTLPAIRVYVDGLRVYSDDPSQLGLFTFWGGTTLSRNGRGVLVPLCRPSFFLTVGDAAPVPDSTCTADIQPSSPTAAPMLAVTTSSLPKAAAGELYSTQLSAKGGQAPYRWLASNLPSSMSVSTTGKLEGTPPAPGTWNVTVTVLDAAGRRNTSELTLLVDPGVQIATRLPDALTVGTSYDIPLAAQGGTQPYAWSITNLPDGLTLSPTGRLQGAPTTVQQVPYTITVRTAKGGAGSLSGTFTVSTSCDVGCGGDTSWVRQLGSADEEFGSGVAADSSGNTYITGITKGTLPGSSDANAGDWDIFLAKYDPAGNRLWVHQLGTVGDDRSYGVAVDGNGNAYLTGSTPGTLPGSSDGNAGLTDAFLAKYDAAGNRGWVHQLGSNGGDQGYGVDVDGSGNAYISGTTSGTLPGASEGNAGLTDAFLAKYDAAGNRVWVHQLGSAAVDPGYGVAVDRSGNAFITGATGGTLPGSFDAAPGIFLVKYDTAGTRLWVHQVSSGSGSTEGFDVAVDSSGSAYITGVTWVTDSLPGASEANAGRLDAFLIKYDATGERQWVHLLGTAGNDRGRGVATDSTDNVYLTGEAEGTLPDSLDSGAGFVDAFLAKYDAAGNRVWVHQLGSNGGDQGYSVDVDGSGNAYISGTTSGALPGASDGYAGRGDVFLAKFGAAQVS